MKRKHINQIAFTLILALGCLSSHVLADDNMDEPSLEMEASPTPMPTPQMRRSLPRKMAPSDRLRGPKSGPKSLNLNSDVAKVVVPKCKPATGKFPWNFDKGKLVDVVDQISRLMCRNFVISSAVKPTQEISIISRTPISNEQAWDVFLAVLEANGLAMSQTGSFYKIINRKDSAKVAVPTFSDAKDLPRDEAMVTYVYELKHAPKDVARSLFKNLVSPMGDVEIYGNNLLVVTDSSANIRRMISILDKIDVPGAANRIHIVDLVYAEAQQLSQKLSDIFDSRSGASTTSMSSPYRSPSSPPSRGSSGNGSDDKSGGLRIIPDERTNKLIIIASETMFKKIQDMIDVLDVQSSDSSSRLQINVYYLKYSDSTKLATTLTNITSAGASRNRNRPGMPSSTRDSGGNFEGDIRITAEESTNSLLIVASPRDYKSLAQVIERLDKRKKQVYVEAVIMELRMNSSRTLGLNLFGLVPTTLGAPLLLGNQGGVQLANNVASSIVQSGANPTLATASMLANFISVLGFMLPIPGVNFPGLPAGITFPGVGAVLNALATNGDVDILSTPSMMTVDNEKAEIAVGSKVPVLKGAAALPVGSAASGLGTVLNQIGYEDVKLEFSVTPHVSEHNKIKLEIEQKVNDLGDLVDLGNGAKQNKILTKSAKTTVYADDQQTVVIGGLISTKRTSAENKIPWLGDIPIIGWFFKSTATTNEKSNLLIILTPYVIDTDADYQKVLDRKMSERKEFAENYMGGKITKYDPFVDYSKKQGPLSSAIGYVNGELEKAENGGPGKAGETVVTPDSKESLPPSKEAPTVPTPPGEGKNGPVASGAQNSPTDLSLDDEEDYDPYEEGIPIDQQPADLPPINDNGER